MIERQLKHTAIFTGSVFVAGGLLTFITGITSNHTLLTCLLHPSVLTCILTSLLFFSSIRWSKLFWLQPFIFFILAAIALIQSYTSFYGLGFYVFGIALLFRLGFFESKRIFKFLICISYLLGIEVFSAIHSEGKYYKIIEAVFFIVAFLVFFYLMFSDKLMVFLNEPKTKLSLEAKGLTDTESGYILSIISGKSVKEAAFEAGVSESTVRNTIARGYKKLGLVNKSGLMALSEKYDITS